MREPPARTLRRLSTFAAIGTAAFLVDAAVLHLLRGAGLDLYSGRLLSFLAAVTFTWWGNRTFTFPDRRSPRLLAEWARFVLANAPGGFANYGVYALLVATLEPFARHPVLAVAAGSLAGLLLNFTNTVLFVFRPQRIGRGG